MDRNRLRSTLRRALSATSLSAVLLGSVSCVATTQTVVYGDRGPLDARLYTPIGGRLEFAVSRPAYVAIFEIMPGRGMSMVYPTSSYESQRRFSSGTHSFLARGFSLGRSIYRQVSFDGFYEPGYLVLIASERPLRVQRMVRSPSALLTQLGFATYYSMANIHAVYRLAEHIVPDPDQTEWTYDTYVIWPTVQAPAIAAYRIVCPDGRTRLVTGGLVPQECLRRRAVTSSPKDTSARDSSEFPAPIPRVRPPRSKPAATEAPGATVTLDRDGASTARKSAVARSSDERLHTDERSSSRVGKVAGQERPANTRPQPIVDRGAGRAAEGRPSTPAPRAEPMREPAAASRPLPEPGRESRPSTSESKPGGGSAAPGT